MRGKTSFGNMLKKAYTPMTTTKTPGRDNAGRTPGMTPGMKKVQFVSTPANHKSDKTVILTQSSKSTSSSSSVTDNLL